jgi:hypothetical protein
MDDLTMWEEAIENRPNLHPQLRFDMAHGAAPPVTKIC